MKNRTRRRRTTLRGGARSFASRRYNGSNRSGKDVIESRRVNRIINQQRQLSIQQNELDIEQLQLVEDVAKIIVNTSESRYFVVGKYLHMFFNDTRLELTEKEIQEIESRIPEGDKKTRFKQYGLKPAIRKILYYTLIMTIIASLVFPVKKYTMSKPRVARTINS